jgi:dienelactone hydrolase
VPIRRQFAVFVYYPNAYHGFDRQLPTRWVEGMRDGVLAPRRLEYDRDAARDADERTKEWLARWLAVEP